MKIIDSADVKKIKEAREVIDLLQQRLLECERQLDDITRCADICVMTKQFHLLDSFIDSANDYLSDRLDLVEYSERNMPTGQTKIKIVENDLSSQPAQRT